VLFLHLVLPTFLVKITGSVGGLASELTVVRWVRQVGLELQQRIRQTLKCREPNIKLSKSLERFK